jgi:hypothetical protein
MGAMLVLRGTQMGLLRSRSTITLEPIKISPEAVGRWRAEVVVFERRR